MCIRPVPFALFVVLLLSGSAHAQVLPPPHVMPPGSPRKPVIPPPVGAPVQILMPPPGTMAVMPPAGKPVPTLPLAALPYPPPGYQPSAYQVWQNYGVTYNGWLRPRVIQTLNSGYFLYNGAPYPYVYVSPLSYYSSTLAPSSATFLGSNPKRTVTGSHYSSTPAPSGAPSP